MSRRRRRPLDEMSRALGHDPDEQVPSGELPYDALAGPEPLARLAWEDGIAERISGLDFEERLRTAGSSWVEADSDGNVLACGPSSGADAPPPS